MSREVDFAAKPIDPDFMNKPDEYPETGTHFDHKVFAEGIARPDADGNQYPRLTAAQQSPSSLEIGSRLGLPPKKGAPCPAQGLRDGGDFPRPDSKIDQANHDPVRDVGRALQEGRRRTVAHDAAQEIAGNIRRVVGKGTRQVVERRGAEAPVERFLQFMHRVSEESRRDDDKKNAGDLKETLQIDPPGHANEADPDNPSHQKPYGDTDDCFERRSQPPRAEHEQRGLDSLPQDHDER